MSNDFFPVFLNLDKKKCVVIGGGVVAERKVLNLLTHNADVAVVSPVLSETLTTLSHDNKISWISKMYSSHDIEDAFLVIGATDNIDVNKSIFQDASKKNILVNCVDDPDHCSFIVPAIYSSGECTIAVSTGGAAPITASIVRDFVATAVGSRFNILIEKIKQIRPEVKKLPKDKRSLFWKKIRSLQPDIYDKEDELDTQLKSFLSCLHLDNQ